MLFDARNVSTTYKIKQISAELYKIHKDDAKYQVISNHTKGEKSTGDTIYDFVGGLFEMFAYLPLFAKIDSTATFRAIGAFVAATIDVVLPEKPRFRCTTSVLLHTLPFYRILYDYLGLSPYSAVFIFSALTTAVRTYVTSRFGHGRYRLTAREIAETSLVIAPIKLSMVLHTVGACFMDQSDIIGSLMALGLNMGFLDDSRGRLSMWHRQISRRASGKLDV